MMSEPILNRAEIVFLYEVKDNNPNGDPLDENKPRIDEDTKINLVSDVRLKRTVRDYLQDFRKIPVFIKESRNEDGTLKTKESRLEEEGIDSAEKLLEKYLDMRLFGATLAIEKKTITFTGPVQFKIGRSLHKVKLMYMKGTTVMPSGKEKERGTFTEQYILPYSLIGFYGVVNENAAKYTGLTENDVDLLLDGLWNGTKNLISRSKVGQMPRLLMEIEYCEKNYHIGDLVSKMKLISDIAEEEIRDPSEYSIDISELINVLKINASKIKRVRLCVDGRLNFTANAKNVNIFEALKSEKIPIETILFE